MKRSIEIEGAPPGAAHDNARVADSSNKVDISG